MRRYKYAFVLALIALLLLPSLSVRAWDDDDETSWKRNGNEAVIHDELDFLYEEEEEELEDVMTELLEYGNVVLLTQAGIGMVDEAKADRMAHDFYESMFNESDDGLVFIIGMDEDLEHGSIVMNTYGSLKSRLRSSQINSIMDNVYNNVSYHDYAGYAQSAFSQTLDYLETGKLAEPMKWVSNIFLAVVIALMINFAIVNHMIRGKKAKDSEVLSGMYQHFNMQNPNMILTNTTKVYDPPSSSGGGRGGGGGGGGGHSSGGHRI